MIKMILTKYLLEIRHLYFFNSYFDWFFSHISFKMNRNILIPLLILFCLFKQLNIILDLTKSKKFIVKLC